MNPDWREGDDMDQKTIATGDRLLSEFDLLVIPRPGHRIQPTKEDPTGLLQFGKRLKWLKVPEQFKLIEASLSSKEVRKRAAIAWAATRGLSGIDGTFPALYELEGLVPMGVVSYIWRRRLFMPKTGELLNPE